MVTMCSSQQTMASVTSQASASAAVKVRPVSDKLEKQADAIASDLQAINQTVINLSQRQLFPHVSLSRDVETFAAAVLLLLGIFAGLLGAQYGRPMFVSMAFVAGIVISMYPIDALLGDVLCGPYYCAPGAADAEFCGWSMAAGRLYDKLSCRSLQS